MISTDKPFNGISKLGQRLENAVMSDVNFTQEVFGDTDHAFDNATGFESLVKSVRFYLDIRQFT